MLFCGYKSDAYGQLGSLEPLWCVVKPHLQFLNRYFPSNQRKNWKTQRIRGTKMQQDL